MTALDYRAPVPVTGMANSGSPIILGFGAGSVAGLERSPTRLTKHDPSEGAH
jgi:hypothetical protein